MHLCEETTQEKEKSINQNWHRNDKNDKIIRQDIKIVSITILYVLEARLNHKTIKWKHGRHNKDKN